MKTAINTDGYEVEVEDNTTVKTVDGVHYLLTPEQQERVRIKNQKWESGKVKRNARVEIVRLEAEVSQRRLREAALGSDGGWLAAQDALITTERNKL